MFTKPRKTEMSLVDLDILETSKYSSTHFFFLQSPFRSIAWL